MRIQDPAIERIGGKRPYYRIRITKPVIGADCVLRRKRTSEFLGYCDETTLSEAKRQKGLICAALNGGPIVVQSQLPFQQLAKRYREVKVAQFRATTRALYESHLANHIEPAFGALKLIEIDRFAVESWLATKSKLSRATRLCLRNILSGMFEAARHWRLWDGTNPCHRADIGRGSVVREKRYLTPEQVARFLAAIQDTPIMPAHHARMMAETAIVAGLRVSELLGLQPGDIDTQRQTVTVRRRWACYTIDEPKTARSKRVVQIGTLAADLLAISGRKWVWQCGDEPPASGRLQIGIWKPAAESAGIDHPGFGMHTLRRLAVTWAQEAGLTPIEAMRRAGHGSISMTALYTLESSDRQSEATGRIIERLRPEGRLM